MMQYLSPFVWVDNTIGRLPVLGRAVGFVCKAWLSAGLAVGVFEGALTNYNSTSRAGWLDKAFAAVNYTGDLKDLVVSRASHNFGWDFNTTQRTGNILIVPAYPYAAVSSAMFSAIGGAWKAAGDYMSTPQQVSRNEGMVPIKPVSGKATARFAQLAYKNG